MSDHKRPAVRTEHGDAQLPDAEDAPTSEDLRPEPASDDAPTTGSTNDPSAVAAPVPAHGEMASQEQLDEAKEAMRREEEGG